MWVIVSPNGIAEAGTLTFCVLSNCFDGKLKQGILRNVFVVMLHIFSEIMRNVPISRLLRCCIRD